MVKTGYAVIIVAITLTMLLVTFWLYIEWSVRHPHEDDFIYEYGRPAKSNKTVTGVQVAAASLLQTGSVDNSIAEKVDGASQPKNVGGSANAKTAMVNWVNLRTKMSVESLGVRRFTQKFRG
ncbi:MAG: hypothetical protein PVS3B3_07190 [Ktedonobacteraceae bacterium]